MITIITGQPGNGKTLFALWSIEEQRKKESREVYYWNVRGLTLPWHPAGDVETFDRRKDGIEPDTSVISRWWELPTGSIIFIDEGQMLFRPRPRGQHAEVITQLEVHRKGGFDIFISTQGPELLDTAVRKLAGRHVHVRRQYGRQQATLLQWERTGDPTSTKDDKEALKTKWTFPKEVFGWYKSAEVHTVKNTFPVRKVVMLVAMLAFAIAAIGYVIYHVKSGGGIEVPEELKQTNVAGGSMPVPSFRAAYWDPAARKERVAGLADSAPMFDHLQQVRSMPAIAGCLLATSASGVVRDCTCYTDQGTTLSTELSMCVAVVQRKVYDPRRAPMVPTAALNRGDNNSPGGPISVAPGAAVTEPPEAIQPMAALGN